MITTGLIPHDDGLAKYAATLFKNSRSCVTRTGSRFSRASSSSCGLRRAFPRKRLDRIGRSARTLSSGHTTALQVLKASAHRCHTPKQFRELLDSVQAFIPYQKLSAVWGYDAHPTLRYVFNYGFPMGFTLVLLDGRVVDESSVSGMASEKTSSHGVRGRGAPQGGI